MRDQIQPLCKWCKKILPLSDKGQPICTFDPIDKWGNIELTPAEKEAVAEAELLSQCWIKDMRKQGKRLCPESYLSQQTDKNYWLSEMAFERLLYSSQMICGKCYCKFADQQSIYEDYTLGLH
jgi:hypothetical protein